MQKDLSILEAKFEAQKLAFGPIYFQAVMAMKKLGILQLIGRSRKGISIDQIAKKLNLSCYGVEVLIEAATSAGVVEILEETKIKLTKVGVILNSDQLTKVNLNFVNDICYEAAKFTTESIQNNKPEGLKVFGDWDTLYLGLNELPENAKKSWFDFDHYYSDDAFNDALEIVFEEKPKNIYDVGGNTGKWSLACCEYDSEVKVKILDLPTQIKVTSENLSQYEYSNRISYHPINLLDNSQIFPEGADVVWMSQFLDCFSENEIYNIINKIVKAIDKDTSVFILEPFIDNQKYPAAEYSLIATSLYFTTVANGNSKMYRQNKMIEIAQKAGLRLIKTNQLIGNSFHTILQFKL